MCIHLESRVKRTKLSDVIRPHLPHFFNWSLLLVLRLQIDLRAHARRLSSIRIGLRVVLAAFIVLRGLSCISFILITRGLAARVCHRLSDSAMVPCLPSHLGCIAVLRLGGVGARRRWLLMLGCSYGNRFGTVLAGLGRRLTPVLCIGHRLSLLSSIGGFWPFLVVNSVKYHVLYFELFWFLLCSWALVRLVA